MSSIEELERLTGEKVTDLHRDNIDHLTIPSARPGQPPLRRVGEVFDCWFESGSMPYAQVRKDIHFVIVITIVIVIIIVSMAAALHCLSNEAHSCAAQTPSARVNQFLHFHPIHL